VVTTKLFDKLYVLVLNINGVFNNNGGIKILETLSDDNLMQLGSFLIIEIAITVLSIVTLIATDKRFEQKHDKAYAALFSIVFAIGIGFADTVVATYGFEMIKDASFLVKGICIFPPIVICLVTIAISDRSEGRWSKKSL
jgi:hypothetical protein